MMDRLAALIVDESQWLPVSMGLALVVTAVLLGRRRDSQQPPRVRVLGAMNLFFGLMIGTMAIGHLLAVSTKLQSGTLRGSALLLYPIGVVLAAPSWLLARHACRMLAGGVAHERTSLKLNAWLGTTLLVLGLHNLPLVAPALLNIGYDLHSRRAVGWAIVGLAIAMNVGLFIGAVIFMASGQTFEQFRGLE
jgi:hypothetical protein